MKKIVSFILIIAVLLSITIFASTSIIPFYSDKQTNIIPALQQSLELSNVYENTKDILSVPMYSTDGKTIKVLPSELDKYKAEGWYENKSDVTVTMYSMDGRTRETYKDEVSAYKAVGWYENKSDVTVTMYAMDGRTRETFKAEVPAYKNVGWYENKSDVTATMYATDGRTIEIYKADIPAYKSVGWYENKSDVTVTMYSMDGRTRETFKAEVPAYKNVGWYENKSDVTATMYATDGRTIEIYKADIPAYKSVGWYENKSDVTVTMYAMDGRTRETYKDEVSAYKAVGWYENKNDVTTTLYNSKGETVTVFKAQVKSYIAQGWSEKKIPVIDPNKPIIALTFDDGPNRSTTTKVLNVLEKHSAKATFFVVGNRISGNEALLKRMKNLGCQIGNHTYSHPKLTTLSSANVASQLNRTSTLIKNATGSYPTVIRPPYGAYNNSVSSTASLPLIMWSLDTLDWKYRNVDYVTNAVLSKVRDGDIVLMHDIHATTASAVERIVPALISRGYQLVTVDELARYKNKTMSAHKSYSSFK